MFQEIEEAVAWLEQRRFITKGIDAFKEYLKNLNNPHQKIPCIHIGGTNGKGSTLNYISQMLQTALYQVGTFTSPYLETHFDRIRLNDENIDQTIFLDIVNTHYQDWVKYELNMFEIDFTIAALFFQQKKPDFVLYEVGLGGRSDATCVVQPLLSIITNIGMDHMELLGDTYEKIAYEKAGIIKAGIPLITAETKEECLAVFQSICSEKKSVFLQVGNAEINIRNQTLQFLYKEVFVDLKNTPAYQEKNICCALDAIFFLKEHNRIEITLQQIKKGLQNSKWKGRFEIVHQNPTIIIDGAHNKEGIDALCASMQSYSDIHIIFSALKDKDHDSMIKKLLTMSDDITVCEFQSYRSATCAELAKQYPVHIVHDYKMAIAQAMKKRGTILITGSLYFISDVRKYILNNA